jgi:hypothetical protein
MEQTCNQPMSPEADPAPNRREGSICPNCGAPGVHRSHRKGFTERLLSLVGARVRRCHACNVRFARLFSSTLYVADIRHALRRAAFLLLMLAGAAFVLVVMLWLMRKQAAIGPSDAMLGKTGDCRKTGDCLHLPGKTGDCLHLPAEGNGWLSPLLPDREACPRFCLPAFPYFTPDAITPGSAACILKFRIASPVTAPAATMFATAALRAVFGDFRISSASAATIPPMLIDLIITARPVLKLPSRPRISGFTSIPPRDDITSSTLAATTSATDAHHSFLDARFCASTAWHGRKCPASINATRHTTTFVLRRSIVPSAGPLNCGPSFTTSAEERTGCTAASQSL